MVAKKKKKIGEIFLEKGYIAEGQLDDALKDQAVSKKRLGEILEARGLLTTRQIVVALGEQLAMPVVHVEDGGFDPSALKCLPRTLIERLNVLPLKLVDGGNTLLVAISDPLDFTVQDQLSMFTNLNVRFVLASKQAIAAVLAPEGSEPSEVADESQPEAQVQPAAPVEVKSPEVVAVPVAPVTVAPEPIPDPTPAVAAAATPVPEAAEKTQLAPTPPPPPELVIIEPVAEPVAQVIPVKAESSPPVQPVVELITPVSEPPTPLVPPVAAPVPEPMRPDSTPKKFFSVMKSQPKLGDILVQAGAIQEAQLDGALREQKRTGKRLGDILVSDGFITDTKLAEALSTQLKLPMFTLTRYRPMPEAIKMVPRHVSERLQLIPLSIVEGDLLLVAMANPLDLLAQDEVRMLTGRDLKVGITTLTEIRGNLDRLYSLQGNLEEAIVEVYGDNEAPKDDVSEAKADDAPVIQLVSNLLEQAVREGASDIHVEPYEKSARIRYRVDGGLYTAFDYPVALHPAVSARLKIMAGMDIAERRKPQDGRILIKVSGRRIDLRVSMLPTMNGEKGVLRILDQESSAVGLERLGLEADDMEKIDIFCGTPWGIMLVTGPTGSGKSTTLYSILEKINKPDVNIITVEDPVEFSVAGINQVHVNEKAGLTFESALRSILRQDPDKVMVGEIRDQQTAQIAIRAALTGHFVLSTLHTNDAPSAATRMVDMGVAPFLVSASITGIIAQRLVKKLCPFCKEEYELNPNLCDTFEVPHGSKAWKPVGCNECRQGYKGRKGLYEILMVDDDLRRMILEGASNMQIRKEAVAKGMKTLRKSGINNLIAGTTSIEEVLSNTL